MPDGTGKLFAKTDGTLLYFCTMKCEKNMIKLHRKARDFKWTAEGSKKAKRVDVD